MNEDIGVITKCYTVTFHRTSKRPASRLWEAITNPDDVEAWMGAPAKIDLRAGGEYFVDFHGNGEPGLDGIIVRVESERKLGYVWGWSYAEWVIEDTGDGCRYTFVHNGLTDRGEDVDEEGLPAGWHEFFERLDDHLDGLSRSTDEHTARWHALKPAYREQLDIVIRFFVTFALLPAVDVADGRAVRLVQGEAGTETASGDPRDAALAWQAGGAQWIHLVDLDAAFGRGSNAELLAAVIGELDVEVQLSGGIRDDASLERALADWLRRADVGTAALQDPSWCARAIAAHGERVAVSLDVRVVEGHGGSAQHLLAARGGTTAGGEFWETLARRLDGYGCARYVVTDVTRDGMLRGPNVELYRAVTSATTAPVIASGGISSIGDLVVLAEASAAGANLEGAIVGMALYAGRFSLREALEVMRRFDD